MCVLRSIYIRWSHDPVRIFLNTLFMYAKPIHLGDVAALGLTPENTPVRMSCECEKDVWSSHSKKASDIRLLLSVMISDNKAFLRESLVCINCKYNQESKIVVKGLANIRFMTNTFEQANQGVQGCLKITGRCIGAGLELSLQWLLWWDPWRALFYKIYKVSHTFIMVRLFQKWNNHFHL